MARRPHHLPMPNLAYEDPEFMHSLGARPLRILAEYFDPLIRLRRANVGDTIVMFGSARIQSRGQAMAKLKQVQQAGQGTQDARNGGSRFARRGRSSRCPAITKKRASSRAASPNGP